MDHADSSDPYHVSESCLCVSVLSFAGLSAELGGDLANLADPGRAYRVPHCEKTPRRRNGDPSTDVEVSVHEVPGGLAGFAQTHCLDVEQLFDTECVVQFNDVEIGGFDSCVGQGSGGGFTGERCVDVLAVVDGLGTGG